MISQTKLIHETNWDILLVLDALRFNDFKNTYKSILGNGGILRKVETPTTFTVGWLIEIFRKPMKNVILISSESMSDRIKDISKRLKHGNDYDIRNHFEKIIDVWKDHYDADNITVPPEAMTNATIKAVKENPNSKILAKYWQVHEPYLYYINKGEKDPHTKTIIGGNIRKILYELISDETYWTIRKKMGMPPENWLANIWLKYGREGLYKGYMEDLKMILTHVKKIKETFPDKKIVVTSDHGERVGEGKRYSHGGRRNAIIKNVPWLEL